MKIKEVIEQLKNIRYNSEGMSFGDDNPDNIWAKDVEAINIAIPIIEKQIAEKPKCKINKELGYMYVCPKCGNFSARCF